MLLGIFFSLPVQRLTTNSFSQGANGKCEAKGFGLMGCQTAEIVHGTALGRMFVLHLHLLQRLLKFIEQGGKEAMNGSFTLTSVILRDQQLPAILNSILCPSREQLGDERPSLSHLQVLLEQNDVFLHLPMSLLDVGVDIARPPLPALLSRSVDLIRVFLQVVQVLADL
jgi:hypothetical protein